MKLFTGTSIFVGSSLHVLVRSTTAASNDASYPVGLVRFMSPRSDKIYFGADDGKNGRELFSVDGYNSGLKLVRDINPGVAGSDPQGFIIFREKMWFSADDGTNGRELFQFDGYDSGLRLWNDINPNGSSNPHNFIVYNEELWFAADDGVNGVELFKTDGIYQNPGVVLVKDINPNGSSNPSDFCVHDGQLWFTADDGEHGRELFVADGSQNPGAKMFNDINPGPASSNPTGITSFDDQLFFAATIESGQRQLMTHDGFFQNPGAQVVLGSDGLPALDPSDFIVYKDVLVFQAATEKYGSEIMMYPVTGNNTGLQVLKDISIGEASSSPSCFFQFDDRLYFAATNSSDRGSELWYLTASMQGNVPNGNVTEQYFAVDRINEQKEINPGSEGSNPCNFVGSPLHDDEMFFTADDGTHGVEVFSNDGFLSSKLIYDVNKESTSEGGIAPNSAACHIDSNLMSVLTAIFLMAAASAV